jgi:Ran GTPase-activating protein (RanGAP) involved in mRNA processing and transport
MISAMIMGYALFVLKMPNIVKILNVCYLTSALIIMKNVDKEYYCETDVDNQIFMWLIKNIFGKKVAIVEEEETREEVDEDDEDEDEEDDDEEDEEEDDSDEDYIPGEDEDPYRKRRVRKLPVTVDECV